MYLYTMKKWYKTQMKLTEIQLLISKQLLLPKNIYEAPVSFGQTVRKPSDLVPYLWIQEIMRKESTENNIISN